MQEIHVESVDQTEIVAHCLGGDGPTLIICHATGFHGRAYAPMADSLLDDFTVWAIDLRGHGASPTPVTGDFTWDLLASDILACIDALDLPDILVFGHSMGGGALLLAEVARPGLIRGAYLYEPIIFPREYFIGRTDNPMAEPARNRREIFPSRQEALARYSSRPPLNQLRADALHAYVEYGFKDLEDGSVRLACRGESEARTFECDEKITLDRVEGFDFPLTVGAGGIGGYPNPATFAPLLVDAIPGSELIVYETLGHFGPLEAPPTIARDVKAALT